MFLDNCVESNTHARYCNRQRVFSAIPRWSRRDRPLCSGWTTGCRSEPTLRYVYSSRRITSGRHNRGRIKVFLTPRFFPDKISSCDTCLRLPHILLQRGQAGTGRTRTNPSERGVRESEKHTKPLPAVNELQAVKVCKRLNLKSRGIGAMICRCGPPRPLALEEVFRLLLIDRRRCGEVVVFLSSTRVYLRRHVYEIIFFTTGVSSMHAEVISFGRLVIFPTRRSLFGNGDVSRTLHCLRSAYQAEELEQASSAKDRSSDNQGSTHLHAAPSHGSTETPAGGRGQMLHRMSPPQHPLSRPSGHPPRPFSGPSRGAGAASGGAGGGEGGMGALLGVASQLRPPRVRVPITFSRFLPISRMR